MNRDFKPLFAYPHGALDDETRERVWNCGFMPIPVHMQSDQFQPKIFAMEDVMVRGDIATFPSEVLKAMRDMYSERVAQIDRILEER